MDITSYTMKRAMQHCLEMCLTEENISLEIGPELGDRSESRATNSRKTWNIGDHITISVKCLTDKKNRSLVAKIFCKSTHFSDEYILKELFYRGSIMQLMVSEIEALLSIKIGPTLYSDSKQFRIVFEEDLSKGGYLPKSPEKDLSLDECKGAINLMAQLHAGSVALYEKSPNIQVDFEMTNRLKDCHQLITLFRESINRALPVMRKFCSAIADTMERLWNISTQDIIDLYNYDPEEFCVLNHGDFCVTNLVFANNDARPLLVNYEMAVYSSPAIDLLHFLSTSLDADLMYDIDELLLEEYLRTLTYTMKSLKCRTTPPTMVQLKAAIQKRILYAVYAGITFKLNTMVVEENKNHYEELAKKMLLIMFYRRYFNPLLESK